MQRLGSASPTLFRRSNSDFAQPVIHGGRKDASPHADRSPKPVSPWITRAFSIDLRSLAVMRIALGVLLLWDLALALSNVKAFYSDDGVITRSFLVASELSNKDAWSLNMMSGSVLFQVLLFLAGMVCATMLLMGWRTRLATFLCWGLVCSMQSRNPAIQHGGDDVIRAVLFWSLFLPLGACWSVDARFQKGHLKPAERTLFTFPGMCLLMQVGLVYLFSAVHKSDPMWHLGGTGLRVALQLDFFVKPLGMWLREHDSLCRVLTSFTMLLEMWAVWLAFVPFKNAWFRIFTVAAFWAFHLGIWTCMQVGPFPFIMMAAWLAFLPGLVWDKVELWIKTVLAKAPQLAHRLLQGWARVLHFLRAKGEGLFPKPSSSAYGLRPSFLANFVTAVCLLYVLCWLVRGTNKTKYEAWFPNSFDRIGHIMRWEQYWGMFSPAPPLDDGWYVSVANLSDGTQVDLLKRGGAVDWEKPHVVSETFWDSRWQKFMANLWTKKFTDCRLPTLRYLTKEWNRTHGPTQQVTRVKLWYVIEMTREDGTVDLKTKPTELAKYVP